MPSPRKPKRLRAGGSLPQGNKLLTREEIKAVLDDTGGDVEQAAAILGRDPSLLRQYIDVYQLDIPHQRTRSVGAISTIAGPSAREKEAFEFG